jgi:membrane-associated protease RseP (regulator of RpoE activity)
MVEGNSILYAALKYAVFGLRLPAEDGRDVLLHPMAWAAWVGLLLTMVNLIPIGQLDGGHIACGFLGKRHERFSARLHAALLLIFAITAAVLTGNAYGSGSPIGPAIGYGIATAMPWLVWGALLFVLYRMQGRVYHPPVGEEPITPGRKLLVAIMLLVFIAIFTPVPLRDWHP